MMRRFALLGLSLLTASLIACRDDDSETTSTAETTDCSAGVFGVVTGEVTQTPITCNDVYDGGMKYDFEAGTYTFAARQRGGSPSAPWRMDTHANVRLQVYVARDAGSLKKGEPVTVDIGDPSSFLVNPRLVVDASGKAAIAFDALGPLAPLLGVDASSPNPVPVTTTMRDDLANAFELDGSLHADLEDCASGYRSIIDQTIARAPASQPLRPQLVSATTTGPDGTRVEAKLWDATYAGKTAPSGHIEADVTGPGTVHHARIDLDDRDGASGTLTLDCAP